MGQAASMYLELKVHLGFALTVASEVFEKPEPSSLVPGTLLAYLQGLKAVRDDGSGNVRIQKPEQGPFYISPKPLDQLIPTLGMWPRIFNCKYITIQATPQEHTDISISPDAADLCVICLERKCDAAFVQCGHMCCCITCSLKLQGKPCPLCRKRGNRILKIYRL